MRWDCPHPVGACVLSGTPSVSSVGFHLSGIGAGQYDVYLLMRQTNTVVAHSQIGYVSTAAAAGNFDYSAYASKTVSFGAGDTPATSAWVPSSFRTPTPSRSSSNNQAFISSVVPAL